MKQNFSKYFISLFLISLCFSYAFAQSASLETLYADAMKSYNAKDYKLSAKQFSAIFDGKFPRLSNSLKYNAACVFALNGESEKAFSLLEDLAINSLFSDVNRVLTDSDFDSLHNLPGWNPLLEKIKINRQTLPARRKQQIISELTKAKTILDQDNGKFWGVNLWNERTLVLDEDNVVYSLRKLAGSQTDDSILFYKTIKDGELSFTNTTQIFQGEKWVTVRTDYLDDNSSTIIHELFHLYHLQKSDLKGLIVEYLDETQARILLRIEFTALRNALTKANDGADKKEVLKYLNDAMLFRKYREDKYLKFRQQALDLENVEGLANYTGLALSSYQNKYVEALKELTDRESGLSLSRSFPYATGVAYGLLFDYLNVNWRNNLTHIYDFLSIYENQILKKKLASSKLHLAEVEIRNDGNKIIAEESKRQKENEKIAKFYQKIFVKEPTLEALIDLKQPDLLISYDMNSTFALAGKGVIYTQIKGESAEKKAFGSFSTISGKEGLGKSGIVMTSNLDKITFPKPIKIEGNKIIGETYEIQLNEGWKVITINKKGDMQIVKSN